MSKLDQIFRARPVEFAAVKAADAIHAAGNAWNDLPDWLIAAYDQGFVVFTPGWIDLTTSMGQVRVAPQDWILCSANEMSICKGEAWERTYEPAPELGAPDRTIEPFGFSVGHPRKFTDDDIVDDPATWWIRLPHQCSNWDIAGEDFDGAEHGQAVAALEAFIAEAQQALAALKAELEFPSALSTSEEKAG